MSVPETPDAASAADLTPPALDEAAVPPPFDPFAGAETAPAPAPAAALAPAPEPRVRWAGIVWGLVLAAIAALGVWVLADAARQGAVTTWLVELTPAAAVAYTVLVAGGFALVAGIVGLARRAQHRLERRRISQPS